jgi:hypothetical protein
VLSLFGCILQDDSPVAIRKACSALKVNFYMFHNRLVFWCNNDKYHEHYKRYLALINFVLN